MPDAPIPDARWIPSHDGRSPPSVEALLLGSVAYAGTTSTDLGDELADASLELQVKTALLAKIGWDMLTVDVEAHKGHVTLEGEADNRANQELAKEVARAVEGVEKVSNRLTLEAKESKAPVGDAVAKAELEVRDAVLESRVKTELISELGATAFDIEVEATDGKVSLRGDLDTKMHHQLAVKTTKACSGVDEVIDLLSVSS